MFNVTYQPLVNSSSGEQPEPIPLAEVDNDELLRPNNRFIGQLVLGQQRFPVGGQSRDENSQIEDSENNASLRNVALTSAYNPAILFMDDLPLLPGLTVVFGGWGTGKTTLFRAIEESMNGRTTTILTGEPINPVEFASNGDRPEVVGGGNADDTDTDRTIRANRIQMDFVSDEGTADIYEGLQRWGGQSRVVMIDSLRAALYSANAGRLASSATNATIHQELLQMSNVFGRSGVTGLAIVNPDREDPNFVASLRATISGSVTQIIVMESATGTSLRLTRSNRIDRTPVSVELDTSFLSGADSRLVGISAKATPSRRASVSASLPTTPNSTHFMDIN